MNIKNLIAVAAITASAMVSTHSFADTNITENVTLTADTDWRADGVVTVPANVTVDLNGYTLWVSGLAGSGTFTSAVADPATFDLTTAQTDATRVKSYQGGTDQSLGTEFTFTIQPAWKLFADYASYNKTTQRAITDFTNGTSAPVDIVYEFDAATAVNSYKIQVTSADSYLERSPRTWKFFGSVTGENDTWVELDSQTDVTDWTIYERRQFTFFNDTAYKFYRLRIIQAHGGGDLGDYLEFFKLEYGRMQNQVRIVPSQAGGFASASNTVSGTAKFVVAGGALAANADLRGLGKVTLEGTLDLNGCVVRAAALDGKGKVTSTFSDSGAFDLTTTQTDDSNVKSYFGDSTEPRAFNTQPAWKAFADYSSYANGQRVIDTTADYPKHIVYDFGTPTFIDVYKLMLGSKDSAPKRAPKTIAFSGSNDGTTWTTLDSRPSETGWSASQERTYSFPSERAYRYYRISFASNNENSGIIEFFRLQYGRKNRNKFIIDLDGLDASDLTNISTAGSGHLSTGDGVLSGDLNLTTGWKSKLAYIDGTIDLNGNDLYVSGLSGNGTITDSTAFDLTDATASRVSTESTFLSTGPATAAFANYDAFNASGQRVIARLDNATLPVCIDYNFGEPTLINAYRVFGNSEKTNKGVYAAPQRQPKSFSFWGSVDGTDWVMLDERKNETAWRFGEMRQYEFANTTAYTRYRIAFYECNGPDASTGESYVDFFKLEYGNIDAAGHLHVVVPLNNTVDNTSVVLSEVWKPRRSARRRKKQKKETP